MAAEARGAAANLSSAATTAIDSSASSTLTRPWLTCTTRPPDGVNPKRPLKAAQVRRTPVMRPQSQAVYLDAWNVTVSQHFRTEAAKYRGICSRK